jgi:hypothetical protein
MCKIVKGNNSCEHSELNVWTNGKKGVGEKIILK